MESPPQAGAPAQDMPALSTEEVRVLGCLLEKSYTTPDYYPMTVNGLVSACNQKSSRYPHVHYDEETVRNALDALRAKGWATLVRTAGARTLKYRHEIRQEFNFSDRDIAVLCVLMLRGPQTMGEVRGRTERIARFEDTAEVEQTVGELMTGYPRPLVKELPRAAGQKDKRYMHLLGSDDPPDIAPADVAAPEAPPIPPYPAEDRLAALEDQVRSLQREVASLRRELDAFRTQFD